MDEITLLYRIALAVGLGLLVGFQREWAEEKVAGIRTFALITLLGLLSAAAAEHFGGWTLAVGLAAVAGFLLIGNITRIRKGDTGPGVTSEIAALIMFVVGGIIGIGYLKVAIAVTGCVALLLHWKATMHAFVRRIGREDVDAMGRLTLIGLVILPVLPNESYGPYEALNPFKIWLLVVLIVSISMGAYIAYKLLGASVGSLASGIFGGLISSTATAISYARRSRTDKDLAPLAAMVILLSSTVVFGRVLVEISIVAPAFLEVAGPPVGALAGFMMFLAGVSYVLSRRKPVEPSNLEPPAALKAAITFGLLYGLVLVGVAWAKETYGNSGLYTVAALSGLTDMDAITLSTAQLVQAGHLDADYGWRLILIGSLANIVFKTAVVAVMGSGRLLAYAGSAFAASVAAGVGILLYWP